MKYRISIKLESENNKNIQERYFPKSYTLISALKIFKIMEELFLFLERSDRED